MQGLLARLLEWPSQNSHTCLKVFPEFSIVCAMRAGAGHCALVGVTHQAYTWVLRSGSGVATRTKPPHQVTGYLISSHDNTHSRNTSHDQNNTQNPSGTSTRNPQGDAKQCTEPFGYLLEEPTRRHKNNAQNPSGTSPRNPQGGAKTMRRTLRVPPRGTRKETQKQ
jgi:hypothetical protein